MSDIFISYKNEDRERVEPIVAGLRRERLDVWWDQDIGPGQPWDETITAGLDAARCVIVVWSTLSVTAPWVKEEAGAGKARGILVPARIHDVDPPLGFGLIQAADLRFWKGDRDSKAWTDFVASIRKILRGEAIAPLAMPPPRRDRRGIRLALMTLALGAVMVAGFLGLGWFNASSAPSPAEQRAWGDALGAKTRVAYEAYLSAYPGGRFAPEAQAGLRSCRMIEEVGHEPFEDRGSVLGVTRANAFGSREDAVLSARDQAQQRAEERCRAVAERVGGLQDMRTRTDPGIGGPQCLQRAPKSWTCNQTFWVICTAQKAKSTTREVCG